MLDPSKRATLLVLALLGLSTASLFPAQAPDPKLSAQGYADQALGYFYGAEFDQAGAYYRKALELDAANPLFWVGLADSQLFQMLLAAGRLDAQLYGESNEFLRAKPAEPDAALVKAMQDALAQARNGAGERLHANPNDVAAHYALGLAYAIEANYDFSLARRYWDALRVSARAKAQHERVLQLDPSNHDASLVIGVYEYAVGSVSAPVRWLLYFAGYSGSKERGIRLIRDTLQNGRRNAPAAITTMALVYAREKKYAKSRQMLEKMLALFPRNYIAELQIAASYQREKKLDPALETYRDVARKMETESLGFDRVAADRLYFDMASLLERLKRSGEAVEFYQKVVNLKTRNARLEAESYLRMGEIYRAQKQTANARQMYENARQLPFPEIQRQATARLRSLPK